jgi:hypothetical protein
MEKEEINKIPGEIGCLNTKAMSATLISTTGFHCKVWQSAAVVIQNGKSTTFDFVIKKHLAPCSVKEIEILNGEYCNLKVKLEEMVPSTIFVATLIDGIESVIAIAETVYSWFNIANPALEEDTIPLLKRLPKARYQLEQFLAASTEWYERENKVIDLYGLDNLVLDKDREIKYIDSFSVFFYEDLLYLIDGTDEMLEERIRISLRRKDYLQYILQECKK